MSEELQYNLIKEILEDEFGDDYRRLLSLGILEFEIENMVNTSEPVIEIPEVTESNYDNRLVRYAVISAVNEYMVSESEMRQYGVQHPGKTKEQHSSD